MHSLRSLPAQGGCKCRGHFASSREGNIVNKPIKFPRDFKAAPALTPIAIAQTLLRLGFTTHHFPYLQDRMDGMTLQAVFKRVFLRILVWSASDFHPGVAEASCQPGTLVVHAGNSGHGATHSQGAAEAWSCEIWHGCELFLA